MSGAATAADPLIAAVVVVLLLLSVSVVLTPGAFATLPGRARQLLDPEVAFAVMAAMGLLLLVAAVFLSR
jgi:hypothetical protein